MLPVAVGLSKAHDGTLLPPCLPVGPVIQFFQAFGDRTMLRGRQMRDAGSHGASLAGIFMLGTVFFSLVMANFLLMSLLAIMGPEGGFGDLRVMKDWLVAKCRR